MPDVPRPDRDPAMPGPQLKAVLDMTQHLILEGIQHGFFTVTIRGEVPAKGRRDVIVEAGKSHKFTVPEDELPRGAG